MAGDLPLDTEEIEEKEGEGTRLAVGTKRKRRQNTLEKSTEQRRNTDLRVDFTFILHSTTVTPSPWDQPA
eukprot:4819696-Ditylum_brightwellii.AAC.1